MNILLLDNYDSFTFNLYHLFGSLGPRIDVVRNDQISVAEVMARPYDAIVLSPGPCTPDEAGIMLDLIAAAAGKRPIFGVCLGHQAIGQAFGGKVVRATPMHGKVSTISHTGRGLFRGLNSGFLATRYHSLIVKPETLPATLEVTASTDDGLIMGMQHRHYPSYGVQFHPESIASENGHAILQNFLNLAGDFNRKAAA